MDAITLLKEDHRKVRSLLKELEATTERGVKRRQELLEHIEQELKAHSQIEEQVFYPEYRDAVERKEDQKLFFEAREEHHVVDHALEKIKESDPESQVFGARAKVLKELVEHHIKEEEGQMFKIARKVMEKSELLRLGERMALLKQELKQQLQQKLQITAEARTHAAAAFRMPPEDDYGGRPI